MAKRNIYVDKDFNQQHIIEGQFEENATPAFDGHETRDANRRYVQLDGSRKTYAFIDDLPVNTRQLIGTFDPSAGALPTGTIEVGYEYVISADGTITGIQGDDELSSGDTLLYVGGATPDPTDPSQWVGVQQNINDGAVIGQGDVERQTVALAANTALTVTATTLTDIHSVQVYDSAGEEIEVLVTKVSGNPEQITLTSNVALTGVVVDLMGSKA